MTAESASHTDALLSGPLSVLPISSAGLPATCSALAERARRGVSFFTALD